MKNKFYVYIYLDSSKPGNYTYGNYSFDFEPFYIGQGHGGRALHHFWSMNRQREQEKNSFFYNKLRKLTKEGTISKVEYIKRKISAEEAKELEISLIRIIGRRIKKEGPLTNITDGGDGRSGIMYDLIKIRCYDREGNFIKLYESRNDAFLGTGIPCTTISIHLSDNKGNRGKFSEFRFRKDSDSIDKLESLVETASNRAIKVFQYDKQGNFIKEWLSAVHAARELNIKNNSISNNCRGLSKTCAGFVFKFKIK